MVSKDNHYLTRQAISNLSILKHFSRVRFRMTNLPVDFNCSSIDGDLKRKCVPSIALTILGKLEIL